MGKIFEFSLIKISFKYTYIHKSNFCAPRRQKIAVEAGTERNKTKKVKLKMSVQNISFFPF